MLKSPLQLLANTAIQEQPSTEKTVIDPNIYQLFYELTPDNFLIAYPDRKFLDCNNNMIESLGYTKNELRGLKSIGSIFTPNSYRKILQLRPKYEKEGFMRNVEITLIKKNGQEIDVSVSTAMIKNEKGETAYHVAVWHEIQELITARKTLEVRNEELNTFAHLIAHDLKAPLFAISNLSQWICEDKKNRLTALSRKHLELLSKRVHRMENLLNDIFSYFFKTTAVIQEKQIWWFEMLEDILSNLSLPQGFQIVDETRLISFYAHKVLLQQVLSNLLVNAIKHHHNKPAGVITLYFQMQDGTYIFAVKDNGPGIPSHFLTEIFKPLKKLASQDKVEGSGMGLAIVKKIVQNEGGEVFVWSELDQGSCFSFSWPSLKEVRMS